MEIDAGKVKAVMIERCFNVRQLAKASGLAECTLNLLINHNRRPNLRTLGKLAKALEVPAAEILK